MATLSSTVALVFQLDDQASKALKNAENRVAAFGKGVERATEPLANATAALIAIEKAVLGLGVALAGKGLAAFAEIEFATVGLTKALGDLDNTDLANAQETIAALAREYGVSTVEVTNSVADFAKAGFDLEDSLKVSTIALKQAIAAEIDAAKATDTLKVIQIAFGISVDELEGKLDKLNTVADKSALNSEQLLDAISKTASVAKAAGFSFEELLANLTPIVETTQEGTESGTAFRTLLASLEKPTDKFVESLAALGPEFDITAFNAGTAKEKFDLLIPALAGVEEQTRNNLLITLAGKEQYNRLLPVVDQVEKVSEKYALTQGKLSTIQDEANRVLDTLTKRYDALSVSIAQVFSTIGAGLVGKEGQVGFKDVVTSLEQVAVAARTAFSSESFDARVFAPLRQDFDALSKIILNVAEILPEAFDKADLSGFEGALNALFGDFRKVELEADDLAEVITTLSDTFESLTLFVTEAEKAFIGPLLAGIETLVNAFNSLDDQTKRLAGSAGGIALLIKVLGAGKTGLLGIILLLKENKDVINEALGIDAFEEAKNIVGFLTKGLIDLLNVVQKLPGFLKDLLGFNELEVNTAIEQLKQNYDLTAKSAEDAAEIIAFLNSEVSATGKDRADFDAYIASLNKAKTETDKAADSTEILASKLLKDVQAGTISAEDALNAYNAQVGLASTESLKLSKELENLKNKGPGLADVFGNFGKAAANSASQIDQAKARLEAFTQTAKDGSTVLTNLGQAGLDSFTDTNQAIDASGKQFSDYVKTQEIVGGKLVTVYSETNSALKTTFADTSKSVEDATKKSEEFQLKLAELASNEKIKTIEAAVTLNVAQIEADTQRVEAAFNSINAAISSTGETISAAFGALGEFAELSEIDLSRNKAFEAILDQLAAENALRQQAFDDQSRLNDAIIDNLRAKTAAFDRGDPLIKIDGTGLEPELRAIMWYMLRAIQVQVNAEFADFLLGLNPDLPPAAPA